MRETKFHDTLETQAKGYRVYQLLQGNENSHLLKCALSIMRFE